MKMMTEGRGRPTGRGGFAGRRAAVATSALAAALLAGLVAVAPVEAAETAVAYAPNYTFADGSKGFEFTSTGGVVDPEVLVGFNPQPEPPGFGGSRLVTGDGSTQKVFTPPSAGGGYSFVMSFVTGSPGQMLTTPMAPSGDGPTSEHFMMGGNNYLIALLFSGPGSIQNWASFNPQPEPPGFWFGSQFAYPAGDPTVTFRITENGAPLNLSSVPEPATWALMIAGFGMLGIATRRRAKTALAAA